MERRLLTFARRMPVRATLLALATLLLTAFAAEELASAVHLRWYSAQLRNAVELRSGADRVATLRFLYRGRTVRLDVPFSSAEVKRAREFEFGPTFARRGAWRGRYVAEVVKLESRSRFTDGFARELRRQRERLRLSSDEYAELIVASVQTIPYGRVGGELKMPVEVIASGSGICTEKTVLLAALLLHEGYRTAVWSLDSHRHVGAGLATAGRGYRGSGYAFVEVTEPAFIGQITSRYAAAGPVFRPPQLIEVGGSTRFSADAQVSYILWLRSWAERAATAPPGTTGRPSPFSARVLDRSTASTLVRWIDWNSHDRERVFERLARASSGMSDVLAGL